MILCQEDVDCNFLQILADELSLKDIELLLVDNEAMKKINLEQRGIDKSTDVLSFPLLDEFDLNLPLGSIVINTELAEQKARELGHSKQEELALLFLHGFLHLLGYDHENDEGQMRAKEEELILKFKLPKSLIIRTEG
ncbi:rRNA maturation RNase YbeY [Campylobacter sp. MIT 97-5078]|uniref:rRNA maturation RNase YbeY n=1 Tax=Campylobacter sp. MIT 97-5078 TaxID=1548153 RepID=UPI00051397A0|nr:rRNA maturation RNase YbeY [Campylobacter sp. MIT 97-5078]KGI56187.1 heat-shock protein [Campylobacter sp. MIT 97-5078]TQR25528.1 rRNA maturation RNase YbeY [Campylobacter sp. MIT 97-5078]